MARIWKYGDNIDTDIIIPVKFLNTGDAQKLAQGCFADVDPEFVSKVRLGDIIVAGENFGCGSSREQAPLALKASGIDCVIAKSFARIFYRNAVNLGLRILESADAVQLLDSGEEVKLDLVNNYVEKNDGSKIDFRPSGAAMKDIIDAGGLIHYINSQR